MGAHKDSHDELHPAFRRQHYVFRRKVFKLFGGAFHVYDDAGQLLFYARQKAFRLREDIRLYSDASRTQELLIIRTPQILDISAVYQVDDATTGETVGKIGRRGLKSIVKDEWRILSPAGQPVGKLAEGSLKGALLSRAVNFVPQAYLISASDGTPVAEIRQKFNPFVLKYRMNVVAPHASVDPRLAIACGILLAAIERRQN